MDELTKLYWQEHGLEGLEIETFLENVQTERYGVFSGEQIRDFLLQMEASILENIETKASEAPQFAAARDEIIQDTIERFKRLREQYAK